MKERGSRRGRGWGVVGGEGESERGEERGEGGRGEGGGERGEGEVVGGKGEW